MAGALALGACSSTYKTASTPDDVYYSPRQQQQGYASNGKNKNARQDDYTATSVAASDDEGGTYVTYSDEQGDYERRLERFGANGSSYSGSYWDGYTDGLNAGNNFAFNYGWGLGYGGGWGYPYSSFGWGYSPYWGSSLSLGFGWGSGFYNPWYGSGLWGYGYPYYAYSPYYYGYYPYYGGGYYGHGWYSGGYKGNYTPTYNRINNYTRPVRGGVASGNVTRPDRGGYQPIGPNTGTNGRPNRINYTPSNNSGGGRFTPSTGTASERPRRVFQQSGNERPVYQNSNSNNGSYSRPQRVEYSRPSQPSYQPSYQPSSAPSRVNSGGGGGGYSRPSRGGR